MKTMERVNENNQQKVEERTAEKTPWTKRLSRFADENYALFFAPIAVAIVYAVALFVGGVWPLGNKYTAASYDLSAQICPFIEHLFDVLQGKSSLFYSYAIAGGADVLGTFLYFFISPFSFVFLLGGDGMVAHMSSIVMLLKLATICFSGVWFAKYLFRGIPEYLCAAIGIVYTYCGYTFVSNTYINWMDFLIYMPFAVAAFRSFVQTGNFLPFALAVACCIYTCFSIACFSMFTVFPCLVFYGLLCGEKGKKHTLIAGTCWAFAIAVLCALPVLLPALSAYLDGARGGDLFENFWYGFLRSSTGELLSFDAASFIKRYEESLYDKLSYIVSDSVFVVLTVVWFCRRGLKDGFAKFMLLCGVATLLPVFVDEAMLLMNMGSYMSYALRFGFLNAIYFLSGACLALQDLCYDGAKGYDGTPLPVYDALPKKLRRYARKTANDGGRGELNGDTDVVERTKAPHAKRVFAAHTVFALLAAAATIALFAIIVNNNYLSMWDDLVSGLSNASSLIDGFRSFSGRFAHSEGGLEVIAPIALIVAAVAIVGVCLVKRKVISVKVVSYFLIVVVGVQVLFYNNQLVVGNRSTQHVTLSTFTDISNTLNAMETDEDGNLAYFRVKDFSDETTAVSPFTANFNSVSVFSSVISSDNFAMYPLFGYDGNGQNLLKSAHNHKKNNRSDEFGDSFWGYKYIIVHDTEKQSIYNDVGRKKWWEPVTVLDENGEERAYREPDQYNSEYFYYVYENRIVFPLAFTTDSGAFRFQRSNEDTSTARRRNQQDLYLFLKGEKLNGTFVTPETAEELSDYLWTRAASEVDVGAGKITVRITATKAGEHLFMPFVASKGYEATVNGKTTPLTENDLKLISVPLEVGENVVTLQYHSPYAEYMLIGIAGAFVGLCAVAFVLKKTKLFEKSAAIVSWAGVALATAVIGFFMLFPTVVWLTKGVMSVPRLWKNIVALFKGLF